MLRLFDPVKSLFKKKINPRCIDNWVFKLHYRVTTPVLFLATVLVTAREYFGEHIKCMTGYDEDKEFTKFINTFCFFGGTFTLTGTKGIYPGIGSYAAGSRKQLRKHSYYQWVPFFLFAQAIMFYVPHLLWKQLEDGRLGKILTNTNPSTSRRSSINSIKTAFLHRSVFNKSWAFWLTMCEFLNVGHVAFQIYLVNQFLGKQFYHLGLNLMRSSASLDHVFPKITKCIFYKMGPSGTMQIHDALCVMALNIINEKIYTFLWFWLLLLLAASGLILLWRFFTLLMYSRSIVLNQLIFGSYSRGRLFRGSLEIVLKHCNYSDWLVLKYLSKNMEEFAWRELLDVLAYHWEVKKSYVRFHKLDSVNELKF